MHAREFAAARTLAGSVVDADGREVPSIFAIVEISRPARHPFRGANRARHRAAEAKARKPA